MSSSKRALIFYPWGKSRLFLGIMIDEIDILITKGYTVDFLICDGFLKNCFANRLSNRSLCNECKRNSEIVMKDIEVNLIYLNDYFSKSKQNEALISLKFEYKNINEIKEINYKECKIGYGALSSYVSYTRNREPKITKDFVAYFDKLLYSQVFLREAIDVLFTNKHYDVTYIFNGRWADMRPFFDYCKAHKKEIRIVENIPVDLGKDYRKLIFKNCLPHNIQNRTEWMNKFWNEDSDITKKTKLGTDYFEARRYSKKINNGKIFTESQVFGELPINFDESKNNISIFLSSEDEFLALGNEWDYLNLFESQEEGIHFILNQLSEFNYHTYIRVHPNLRNVHFGYHKRLIELQYIYSNVTVIEAESTVSTYALVDASDKVVVFGSSVGVEACFAQKPVILLGGSLYYYLDVAYLPEDKASIIPLISDNNLQPKSQVNAMKYGYYFMNIKSYSSEINYNPKPVSILGLNMSTFPFYKIFGSAVLGRVYLALLDIYYYLISRFFEKPQFKNIPIDGD